MSLVSRFHIALSLVIRSSFTSCTAKYNLEIAQCGQCLQHRGSLHCGSPPKLRYIMCCYTTLHIQPPAPPVLYNHIMQHSRSHRLTRPPHHQADPHGLPSLRSPRYFRQRPHSAGCVDDGLCNGCCSVSRPPIRTPKHEYRLTVVVYFDR